MSISQDTVRIQMSGCRDCVHILQAAVEVMGKRIGLDDLAANRVILAVDELYANIIRHGYQDDMGPVEFEVEVVGKSELRFIFRDFAPPLHDTGFCCKKGDDAHQPVVAGGLGMHLICSIMDEVNHEALADGNRWVLRFGCEGERNGSGT